MSKSCRTSCASCALNSGNMGAIVLALLVVLPSIAAVSLEVFYPFGPEKMDNILQPGDDTSSMMVELRDPVVFYNNSYTSLFVNMNGHVSFDSPLPNYRPDRGFPRGMNPPAIAVFMADVDTTRRGTVYYRWTQQQEILDRAAIDINTHFTEFDTYVPSVLLIVTWSEVGYYRGKSDKMNTFQLVLATDGQNSFAFFHYLDGGIQWMKSDGKYSPRRPDLMPQAGFDGGRDGQSYSLRGSGDSDEFISGSNTDIPGAWIFQIGNLGNRNIRSTDIQTGDVTVFEVETGQGSLGRGPSTASYCTEGAPTCHENAQCFDYSTSFCCECDGPNYYGNGIYCVAKNSRQVIDGTITGTVNGVDLGNRIKIHTQIITRDGRTYSNVKNVPKELQTPFQTLTTLGGVGGWLYGQRKNENTKNGLMITGSKFNMTSRITYSPSDGQRQVLRVQMVFKGHHQKNQLLVAIQLDGEMPDMRYDARITFNRYRENFKKIAPGTMKSFVTRIYRVDGVSHSYTWDNTITYEECAERANQDLGDVMSLEMTNFFAQLFGNENDKEKEKYKVVRLATQSHVANTAGYVNPCDRAAGVCHANADCVPRGDDFECRCKRGYTGDGRRYCQVSVNPCERSAGVCDENAECIPRGNDFMCRCRRGFTGDGRNCTRDNPCDVCHENADCSQRGDDVVCSCKRGYTGDGRYCEREVNPCDRATDVCDENAECFPRGDDIVCRCRRGFTGDGRYCEREAVNPCERAAGVCDENAECFPRGDDFMCRCRRGYTGDGRNCEREERENPCERAVGVCDENAECIPRGDDFACRCRRGYTGDGRYCEREVRANPCERSVGVCDENAECIPMGDDFACRCRRGFYGDGRTCEREGGALTNPCERLGRVCHERADCVPVGDDYTCTCQRGYTGDGRYCTDINECEYNSCGANSRCQNLMGAYRCECDPGFVKDDSGECRAQTCRDADICSDNAECVFDPVLREHVCECMDDFSGDGYTCESELPGYDSCDQCDRYALCTQDESTGRHHCECRPNYTGDGTRCDFIESCRNCNRYATCEFDASVGDYTCVCGRGYKGDGETCEPQDCREDESMCDPEGGLCWLDQSRNFSFCRCNYGYRGDGYDCRKVGCDQYNDCDRNALCVFDGRMHSCQCNEGYVGDGKRCTQDTPISRPATCTERCDANARCLQDRDGRYYCRCNRGYEGDGTRCTQAEVPCNQVYNCDRNAECLYNPDVAAYQCRCSRGFEGDGKICRRKDINDCRRDPRLCHTNAECVQGRDQGYVCVCRSGFRGDGAYCDRVINEGNSLIYAQGNKIMRISAEEDSGEEGEIVAYEPGMLAVGVEVDCKEGNIYWTDAARGVIKRSKMDGTEKQDVVNGMKSPEGIAIDFVARNMFFTDSEMDSLMVAKLNGEDVKTLVNTEMYNPRAIVLDVNRGVIYWTDWNRKLAQIERINMDGTQRSVLVNEDIKLPNGLAFDPYSQTLCWGDAGTTKIECIRSDGTARRVILQKAMYPFDIAMLNNVIYWTDWKMKEIPNVSQNGQENTALKQAMGGNGRSYGITAVTDRCPRARNSCELNNGGCKYLCLPTAQGGRTCECPDGMDPRVCQQ